MKTSANTNEIDGAMAKAQGEMKNPEKNKTATIPLKSGGAYSFDYADLPSTYDTNRIVLSKHGLSHAFGTSVMDGGAVLCTCRLAHSSGQWYLSEMLLPPTADVKAMAGNLTYLKRYLFCGLTGVTGDDDVDGEPEHQQAKYEDRKSSAPKLSPSGTGPKIKPKDSQPNTTLAAQKGSADVLNLAATYGWTPDHVRSVINARWAVKGIVGQMTIDQVDELVFMFSNGQFQAILDAQKELEQDPVMDWEKAANQERISG